MALTIEWRRRIDNFIEALKELIYQPLGDIQFQGFSTKDQLSFEIALQRDFIPMPAGTAWGAKWEYGWFKGEAVLPDAAAGKRIVLRLDLGGEGLIWVNGQVAGSIDHSHPEITLCKSGVPGERYEILAEVYAGHGRISVGGNPIPFGVETVPEPGLTQKVVNESDYGIWEEAVYQLYLDISTLLELRDNLDSKSLRVAEIDRGLMDVTLITDLELRYEKMVASVHAGRERLRSLLMCVNGSTMPVMYAFGHAHLDVAWLWPLQETERKIARTIANQLALMEEYPEYIYLQSQPHLLFMLQHRYPELYSRVQQKAKIGQFIVEGGSWVEPDTNLTGGESLIRQFLYGKKFFKEEFGVDCEIFWEPDVFGYSGALPQILRGCDIKYFATAKLTWVYNGADPFPYNIFTWQGIDGSEVLAHVFAGYGNRTSPAHLIESWNNRLQAMDTFGQFLSFGEGDGGGGATRDHLEYLKRDRDLEGAPRVQMTSPNQFFKDVELQGLPRNRYVGELYYSCHRGTYTSQARTKRNNRKSELMLREAELWGTICNAVKNSVFPRKELHQAWKAILLNQFHDVLPGSSIARVYEETEVAYSNVISNMRRIIASSAEQLVEPDDAVTVFNSLSWPRTAFVELPEGFHTGSSSSGEPLNSQVIGGDLWAEVKIPACGWTTLKLQKTPTGELSTTKGIKTIPVGSDRFVIALLDKSPGTENQRVKMENEFIRVELNETGEIVSLYDKANHRELTAAPCNVFKMYKDVPSWFDAWDIDSMYQDTPLDLERSAQIELISSGPLMAIVRVTRVLNSSSMVQDIYLRRGSRRIDFATQIDWQERHKLLKVNFPVNIHANEAIHEIQFGHIKRPNHASRPFDADRFEVSNHKWTALAEENRGAAVLNDCKYGVSVVGNSINLTLLKSAMAPDMRADQGLQQFTYSLYTWNGSLADSPVVQEAYDLNVPVWTHPGSAGEHSVFSVSAPNVVIETVKLADDDSSDVVIRLYEAKRMATRCVLSTSLPVKSASLSNMLEVIQGDLLIEKGRVDLDFRAFEVKTIRLKMAG